jgi:hypothetical protein
VSVLFHFSCVHLCATRLSTFCTQSSIPAFLG